MSQFSSCTLATLFGAAVGAGVTYMLLKDKDELAEHFDEGMQIIDKVADDLEVRFTEFFDSVEKSFSSETDSKDVTDTKQSDDSTSTVEVSDTGADPKPAV